MLHYFYWGQTPYPQDYFKNPLDVPVVLSGSFAELRSNHFHSGLDIKTQGKEGLKVYASADGYVSRIKVSHFGYGKALYITHPNGYTTVYAHLQKFAPKIDSIVKQLQYKNESYEVEYFPKPSEIPVKLGEIVGFSGNTGGSGGPHLHFEIRDNQERPINPMLFGINTKDTKKPVVSNVYVYPIDANTFINGKHERHELRLIRNGDGNYTTEEFEAIGTIGFGIVSYDQQDLAPNKNGVDAIYTSFNGTPKLSVNFKRFSFDETSHLNRYIDYEVYKTTYKRVQKLFFEKNNPLSLITSEDQNGYCQIQDSTFSIFNIEIKDFSGNTSTINVPIQGKQTQEIKTTTQENLNQFLISESATTVLEGQNNTVIFYPNSVYEDVRIDFNYNSDTLFLHKDVIPLRKTIEINYDISAYKEPDKSKMFIAQLYGYKQKPSYVSSLRKENTLTARTKTLGTFTLAWIP